VTLCLKEPEKTSTMAIFYFVAMKSLSHLHRKLTLAVEGSSIAANIFEVDASSGLPSRRCDGQGARKSEFIGFGCVFM
jgi:hypothetical protein